MGLTSWLISFKRAFPWLWRLVEDFNGMIFFLRHRNIIRLAIEKLESSSPEGYEFSLATQDDVPGLMAFLNSQPEESFRYFRPHRFDEKTLRRIIKGYSFLVMKVTENSSDELKGYFFLRCFCDNRAFAGLLVDHQLQDRGIGTFIWTACSRICRSLGIRMFATIDKKNLPSLRSCDKGTEIVSREELYDDYLLVECRMKEQINKKISPAL